MDFEKEHEYPIFLSLLQRDNFNVHLAVKSKSDTITCLCSIFAYPDTLGKSNTLVCTFRNIVSSWFNFFFSKWYNINFNSFIHTFCLTVFLFSYCVYYLTFSLALGFAVLNSLTISKTFRRLTFCN